MHVVKLELKTSEPDQENSYKKYARQIILATYIDNIATKKCWVQSKINVRYNTCNGSLTEALSELLQYSCGDSHTHVLRIPESCDNPIMANNFLEAYSE